MCQIPGGDSECHEGHRCQQDIVAENYQQFPFGCANLEAVLEAALEGVVSKQTMSL